MSLDQSNEETILEQALSIASVEERNAYLQGVCKGDSQLRSRVESLIAAHLGAGNFLSGKAVLLEEGPRSGAISEAGPGTAIGRYKLLQKIGEGGMGVVYMAEQEEPVRRRVALKIIKLGMDTQQVVARFEAERQALALMDHPHIAKVLDGGATDTGRPYFVMELVQGIPITEFCDKNHLGAEERIKLFIQVCQAIQSAHQKRIIHRDLKPTNILVTLNAGVPHPMVIDFGVAKATQQKLTEKTVFTNYATMIGTPAYMSPEQAEMSRLDVGTRSDIYGLGVLLYELLTGTTPFPEKRLRSVGYNEMQRIILEEEPERPSTRLRLRASTPSPVTSHHPLATDLDWIVMKCLEKDRSRRYETANGLAADLNRHLENEPVVARPTSNLYRLQKMVRRNKLAFAAGAMVALALLVGMALAAWQAVRASQERDAKELALRQSVAAQREESRLREQAETQAYASDMLLAQQAIAANNFGFARQLLNRHRPQSRFVKDLRGWEWRYLWQQCRSDALATVWQSSAKISGLAASHDGKWLAVGQNSDATAVSLLKFANRTTLLTVTNIPARRGTDVNVAFSPAAPFLAFNSSRYEGGRVQPTLHLWNVETRQQLLELPVPAFCGGLAFSPDGSTLLDVLMNLYGDTNGGAMLLKIPEGTPIWKCETPVSQPCPVIAVDAGFRSAAIAGDRLQIIDLATGKVRWSVTNEYFSCSAFTGDGKMLMTAQGTPSIFRAWDVSSGKPVARPVPLHSGRVDQFSLLPDGRTLVSESNDGSIQMWDVSDPTNPQALGRPLHGQGSQINWLALDSDAKTLFSGNFDGSIYAWDPKPRNPEKSPVVLTGVFDWQFAPDDRSLLTIDPRGHVTRREGPDFQVKNPLLDIGSGLAFVRDQAEFSDDGQLLAVSQAGEVRVWDLRNHSPSPRFVTPGWLGTRAFAPHSKLLVAYKTISGPLEEWDLNTFQKISSWPTTIPWKYLSPIALSSRGQYLLSASPGGSEGVVIETSTGQAGAWKNPESGEIGDLSFSADGSLFAAANWGGYAQVWDSRSRRLVMTLGHRQYPTTAVNFSPDDSRLVTASEGPDTLTLWDLSGRELLRLQTAAEQFMSVKFSADGTWLACHNYDNDLYLWRAPSWAEIEAAEKTVSDSQSSNMQKGNL